MSSFCVFGVTREQCKKIARDKISQYDKDIERFLTQEEYAARVDAMAKELFEGGARSKQISPAFDAPQFARDWIAVGLKAQAIRTPKIMVLGVKCDKQGAEKMNKKGLPVISWLPYKA